MTGIPWRIAIERAMTLHGNDAATRWVQLATVDPEGGPSVRTVVFRGFLDGGQTLRFTTDTRSTKVEHLARDPRAEACWFFPRTREQYRLNGRLTLVGEDEPDPAMIAARADQWRELATPSRLMFSWPDPGGPRSDPSRFRVAAPASDRPPPTFGLLLLEPWFVDHLDLRPDPHLRRQYRRNGQGDASRWECLDINP